ncbi:hypothetical protein N7476_000317 [Penicillium atrosanguineum]|uniref:Uncharacterized protein n=1 Tax=Penicillium atrosanguineum TaxID=1132637 RepID=A0A9W9QCP9_9EURO|nr:hypothetical protein N7476_000317 [Penicillium atrosanguineum]
MADPVDQISTHEQGKYHVPVSTPLKDQALTLENFSRDRPLHEAQLHSCAPLQEDHEDQATRRRNVRKSRRSSPVSSTIRRDLIESSSTNVTWPSGSANKRYTRQQRQLCQEKVDAILILQSLYSLLGVPGADVPFRAQNLILQAMQRHLEYHAFQFAHKWLRGESVMNGWTCPEELELHTFFKFMLKNLKNLQLSPYCHAGRAVQRWKSSVSKIRHAAVHRLIQDRESLLQMNLAAIEFVMYISGSSSSEKLQRLFDFLETRLPKPDRLRRQRKPEPNSKASLRKTRLEYLKCRFILPPEPVKEVLQWIEKHFTREVERFLKAVFQ